VSLVPYAYACGHPNLAVDANLCAIKCPLCRERDRLEQERRREARRA
jgi:hypothetical protein